MPFFAGPLSGALARARMGGRAGEQERYQRQQYDREYEDNALMRSMALQNQRDQTQSMQDWRDAQIGDLERRRQEEQAKRQAEQAQAEADRKAYEETVAALVGKGVPETEARAAARDPATARNYLAPPKPETPRNIDPLSPQGIKARLEFERGKPPPTADVPDFLRPNAIQERAAQLTQPWYQSGMEVAPGLEPRDAAAKARKDIDARRQAAFESERDQLKELYQRAYDNAETDVERETATKAYMDAQANLLKKFRIGSP